MLRIFSGSFDPSPSALPEYPMVQKRRTIANIRTLKPPPRPIRILHGKYSIAWIKVFLMVPLRACTSEVLLGGFPSPLCSLFGGLGQPIPFVCFRPPSSSGPFSSKRYQASRCALASLLHYSKTPNSDSASEPVYHVRGVGMIPLLQPV